MRIMTFTNIFSHLVLVWFSLYFLIESSSSSDLECKEQTEEEMTDLMRLYYCLLSDLDKESRPVKDNKTPVNVSFVMQMNSIDYNEKKRQMYFKSRFSWNWTDEFLKWNKKDYGDIDELDMESRGMWTPPIQLHLRNRIRIWFELIAYSKCKVTDLGKVSCSIDNYFDTLCSEDIYYWPYDIYTCSIRMGSIVYPENQLILKTKEFKISSKNIKHGSEWKIHEVKINDERHKIMDKYFSWTRLEIKIQRQSNILSYSIVIPAFVISVMTLISLWLDSNSDARFLICCTSLVCHIIYMIFLGTILPNNGQTCPRIVLFFKDSFFLSILIFVSTVISNKLSAIKASDGCPVIVASTLGWLLASRVGQIIFLCTLDPMQAAQMEGASSLVDDDYDNTSSSLDKVSGTSRQWDLASRILDRLIFIILCFIYFVYIILFWT